MKFTDDEVAALVYSLKWHTPANKNGCSYPTRALSHPHNLTRLNAPDGEICMIKIIDLLRILRDPFIINDFSHFYHIIHAIPLEQMPLYLQDYPEIATWRLKIAK